MKTRITIGASLLLTLGSALAGGLLYQNEKTGVVEHQPTRVTSIVESDITPELIAKWKATATTTDYSPPMLPI